MQNAKTTTTDTINPQLALATFRDAIVPKLTTQGLTIARHYLRTLQVSELCGITSSLPVEHDAAGKARLQATESDPVGIALLFASGAYTAEPIEKVIIEYEQLATAVNATTTKTPDSAVTQYSFDAFCDWWSHEGPQPEVRRERCVDALARIIVAELKKRTTV